MSKSLGKILHRLRREQQLSQKELCNGLCSISTLSRIETGTRDPDQMLFDSLITRLGKDSAKWQLILKEQDKQLLSQRNYMEYLIEEKNWEELEQRLNQYTLCYPTEEPLPQQYICLIQALLLKSKKQYKNALEVCYEGLYKTNITIDISHLKIQNRLSRTELKILCTVGEILLEEKETSIFSLYFYWRQLLDYINTYCNDQEYRLLPYIQINYYLSRIMYEQNQIEEAVSYFEHGFYAMTQKRTLYYFEEFLTLLEELRNNDISVVTSLNSEHISYLLSSFKEWKSENKKIKNKERYIKPQANIYSINEIIKNARNFSGKTQEEVIHEQAETTYIGAQPSLSQIECGKRNPHKTTAQYYLERLGLEGKDERFHLQLQEDDFELQELRWQIDFYISDHRYNDANDLLSILKQKIDLSNPYNQQYVRASELYIELGNEFHNPNKRYSSDERKEQLFDVLSLTLGDMTSIDLENFPFFTTEELFLLMNIGATYHASKEYEKSLHYYECVDRYVSKFYQSASARIYCTNSYNISQVYGLTGAYEKSMKKSRLCIFLMSINHFGYSLGRAIYNIGWCYEKIMEQESDPIKKEHYQTLCRKYFHQAYSFAKLYDDRDVTSLIESTGLRL